jgi:hypothetical protein
MRPTNSAQNQSNRDKVLIRTTFYELIDALIDVTKNDAEILASVKQIFDRSDVRMVRSLAPVQLVTADSRARINVKDKAVKAGPAWA